MLPVRVRIVLAGLAAIGAATAAQACLFAPSECDDLLKCPGKGAGGAPMTATGTGGPGSGGSGGSGGEGGGAPVCGNHLLEPGEGCDDGNLSQGDGCSPTCTIEPLDACPGLPINLAPPGLTIQGTLLGAHDDTVPGCGKSQLDMIYEVTPTVSGTLVLTLSGAYEKSLSVRSSCLNSVTAELACGAGTGDLVLRRWVYPGVKYSVVVDAGAADFALQLDLSTCGDGAAQELEECDDASSPTCIGCFTCSKAGEVFDPVSRHCYRRLPGQAKDWKGARNDCLAWGGDLVGVSSTSEADFLKAHFDDVWTGATDAVNECAYAWVNGEPWQPHWAANEPNTSGGIEDCGVFHSSGLLVDVACSELHDALCERAPGGLCGDGIVQPGEECDDAITSVAFICAACKVVCPFGQIEDPVTRHCYEIVPGPADWSSAQAQCAAKGAYLAAITSTAENALLQPSLTGPTWIGASRVGVFSWINTDAFCFENWANGEPSAGSDCVTLKLDGTWTTSACDQKRGYVCEHDN